MSDRFATQIEIGGLLETSRVQEFIDAINSERMSLEWGECPVKFKDKDDLARNLAGSNDPIILMDDERSWGGIEDLENTCQELGLTYKTTVFPKYEYDGELTFWSPQTGLVQIVTDSSGHPIATQEDLKEILHLIYSSTLLSISEQIQKKINQAIKKLEELTREFVVPEFKIGEK